MHLVSNHVFLDLDILQKSYIMSFSIMFHFVTNLSNASKRPFLKVHILRNYIPAIHPDYRGQIMHLVRVQRGLKHARVSGATYCTYSMDTHINNQTGMDMDMQSQHMSTHA